MSKFKFIKKHFLKSCAQNINSVVAVRKDKKTARPESETRKKFSKFY